MGLMAVKMGFMAVKTVLMTGRRNGFFGSFGACWVFCWRPFGRVWLGACVKFWCILSRCAAILNIAAAIWLSGNGVDASLNACGYIFLVYFIAYS